MTVVSNLSRGFSKEAKYNAYALTAGRSGQPLVPEQIQLVEANAEEERLFSALAEMKVFFSKVAMHMDRSWRDRLFKQLDRLHDTAQWDEADDPVEIGSFRTFLRMMFLLKPDRPPGIALANHGHLLAYWINGRDRLTIECLGDDKVKIVFTRWLGDEPDRGAIMTNIDGVFRALIPYNSSCWFKAR
jgi:hypothetical protein